MLENQDLVNLPVETQSGESLGHINHFEIDPATQEVVKYYVKAGLIKNLWKDQLVIDRSQVISISKEKMVVEDTTSKVTQSNPKLAPTG
ncbi:MAG: hypothetical protein COT81_04250 [Candidatus Buchananbacteria bacterium CG10_big_fil_rev_8_21_14_0_10_42_9]|uniref:PRC-barrel domain-containing protein n=1 Tax=Candidatus Buchananbacteria bacterium CG10_big_fil_rev_8_21_14_0_10_42_9 TaxID=1974526 RepID=A0A2H0W2I7_9BACT|nr:MAG: hypothetical protein COT81_04250 [Candidatus Buchananbacteria bacterium CG10_big_fil_rev_8_21_14_0_10_42_9]